MNLKIRQCKYPEVSYCAYNDGKACFLDDDEKCPVETSCIICPKKDSEIAVLRAENEKLKREVTDHSEWARAQLTNPESEAFKAVISEIAALKAQLAAAREALKAIIVRCEEGDKRCDWIPIILDIAKAARGEGGE